MSSLARRTVRTTAAAAGIAAIGIGFAGHALAAPEAPELPGTDILETPAVPDLGATPDMLSELPDASAMDRMEVPGVFVFEIPTVSMETATEPAGPFEGHELDTTEGGGLPEAPALPEAPELDALGDLPELPLAGPELPSLPAAPGTDEIVNYDSDVNGVESPDLGQVGAMPGLDTATMFAEMTQQAMAG